MAATVSAMARAGKIATHHAVQGGHDPRRVPAWAGLVDYVEQNFGTWTFPGGFGQVAAVEGYPLGAFYATSFARNPDGSLLFEDTHYSGIFFATEPERGCFLI